MFCLPYILCSLNSCASWAHASCISNGPVVVGRPSQGWSSTIHTLFSHSWNAYFILQLSAMSPVPKHSACILPVSFELPVSRNCWHRLYLQHYVDLYQSSHKTPICQKISKIICKRLTSSKVINVSCFPVCIWSDFCPYFFINSGICLYKNIFLNFCS